VDFILLSPSHTVSSTLERQSTQPEHEGFMFY